MGGAEVSTNSVVWSSDILSLSAVAASGAVVMSGSLATASVAVDL